MNAPILWIVFPLFLAAAGWFLRRWPRVMQFVLAGFSFLLALLALELRIDSFVEVGPWTVKIDSTLEVLGRNFTLLDSERGLLVLIFTFTGFWLLGMRIVRVRAVAAISALSVAALLIAARSVEPFLFSALLIEVAVLFSIPALVERYEPSVSGTAAAGAPVSLGNLVPRGLLRYLTFQTLAVPFILLAGWAATEVEFQPNNLQLVIVAAAALALGLAFWLAAFPFYTWVPMLFAEVNPFSAGLILTLLPIVALFLLVDFINGFAWLRSLPQLVEILRLVGVVMVATAGIWAAFERNIFRILGFAVVLENGFALLALSLSTEPGLGIASLSGPRVDLFVFALLPRVVAVGLGSLALAILRQAEREGKISGVAGLLRHYPLVAFAIILSVFSLAGFPLFAGFPVRMAIYEGLAAQGQNQAVVLWAFMASVGLLVGGLRSLLVFVSACPVSVESGEETVQAADGDWPVKETRWQVFLLVVGIVVLVLIGLFPGLFLPMMSSLLV